MKADTLTRFYLAAAGIDPETAPLHLLTRATNDCREFTRRGSSGHHRLGGLNVEECAGIFWRARQSLPPLIALEQSHPAHEIGTTFPKEDFSK
jgi:hypothetical protein